MIEKLPEEIYDQDKGKIMAMKINQIILWINEQEKRKECKHRWEWSRRCDSYGNLIQYCSKCGSEKEC